MIGHFFFPFYDSFFMLSDVLISFSAARAKDQLRRETKSLERALLRNETEAREREARLDVLRGTIRIPSGIQTSNTQDNRYRRTLTDSHSLSLSLSLSFSLSLCKCSPSPLATCSSIEVEDEHVDEEGGT